VIMLHNIAKHNNWKT